MLKRFAWLILLLPIVCFGTDLIGSWDGKSPASGSRAGSSSYIRQFGRTLGTGFGSTETAFVTLTPWAAQNLWSGDSLANDSTLTWNISEWCGGSAIIVWQCADTGVSTDPKVTFKAQGRYAFDSEGWVNIKVFGDSDSVETVQIDTLSLANPFVEFRLYADGKAGNSALKATKLSAFITFTRKIFGNN